MTAHAIKTLHNIDSGNGLLPIQCQAINWTKAYLVSIWPWEQISVKFKSNYK